MKLGAVGCQARLGSSQARCIHREFAGHPLQALNREALLRVRGDIRAQETKVLFGCSSSRTPPQRLHCLGANLCSGMRSLQSCPCAADPPCPSPLSHSTLCSPRAAPCPADSEGGDFGAGGAAAVHP